MEKTSNRPERILVTGASGFIGSFIVEEALRRGMEVWACVRHTSNFEYLRNHAIHFLYMDLSNAEGLIYHLDEIRDLVDKFDYVVHCAGVTKCADKRDFDLVNNQQTRNLATALIVLDMVPRQFLFISSLSAYGPVHEPKRGLAPICCEDDVPAPETAYGQSKLAAEVYLQALKGFPYVFLRLTGVYGPRERDYYQLARSIARHVDVTVGFRPQYLTFVYVADVVQAVFLAIDRGVKQCAYTVSDGNTYSSREFSDLIAAELGHPFLIRLKIPLFVLKGVCWLSEHWARCRGKASTLNSDKYKIMKQRNWQCDISLTVKELGYRPAYDLKRGVKETIAWYKKERWL